MNPQTSFQLLKAPQQFTFAQPAAQLKKGGFDPTALISEALGTVGGVGGFALGGPVGAAAGAALFGGAGSALEQKVRDNKVDVGKSVREGVLEGLFAGGPIKLAKAVPTIAKGVKRAGQVGAKDAASELSDALRQVSPGVGDEALRFSTIAGKSTLNSATDQANLIDLATKFPELRGSAAKKFKNVESVMGKLSGQVDDLLKGVPNTVPSSRLADTAMEYAENLSKADRAAFTREYTRIIKEAFGGKPISELTATDINRFRRIVNRRATRAFNGLEKGIPLSSIDNGVLELRDLSDDLLEAVSPAAVLPDVRRLNNQLSSLIRGQAEWKRLSEEAPQLFGTTIPIVSPFLSRTAQAGADITGRTARKLAGGSVAGQAARVGAGSAISSIAGGAGAPSDVAALSSGLDAAGTQTQTTAPTTQPSTLAEDDIKQAILLDLQETGGKNYDQIMLLASQYGPASYSQTKPLSAEAAKVVSNAQTGIQALQDFASLIQADPGAFSRTGIPGTGTLDKLTAGRASGALGTSSLNAARQQIIDVIARLRTGAAITNDEAARFETFVPQPGDPPETRMQKISYLIGQFQMVANRSGSAGTDLQAAVQPQ